MATLTSFDRVRKAKTKPSLDSIIFATPEQKLLRFLISNPTTSYTPRVLSSKLKGVRGLGGVEGIKKIIEDLYQCGVVQYVNNNREICADNDSLMIKKLKTLAALCDLEGLKDQLKPISNRGILFGSRANGKCTSVSDYNLMVVTDVAIEVEEIVTKHPIGKRVTLVTRSPDEFLTLEKTDRDMSDCVTSGIQVWGSAW